MEQIDISKKMEDFYHHLNEEDVDRTIFSAQFGDGKTEFLHQFKEKYQDQYDFYTLYPVNYQIAPNEQIMEYIKRDLLFQLILHNRISPSIKIPDAIVFQWYLSSKTFDIIQDFMKFAPSLIGAMAQYNTVLRGITALATVIDKQYQKYCTFKEEINNSNFDKASQYIEDCNNEKGSIYELDPISWLIAQSIADSNGKTPILIIEDLDRIDPAHLFRVLNIFSAHIDRHYLCSDQKITDNGKDNALDKLQNKFGFKKVVFVMDAQATKSIFENFYGNYNYEGYISKFISKHIFEYSIREEAKRQLNMHIKHECQIDLDNILYNKKDLKLSVRDIARVLDNFNTSYRQEEIQVTDNFHFLSDTPLVKLLAIFSRLGIKRQEMAEIIKNIGTEREVIYLLGCFALDKKSIAVSNCMKYREKVYKLSCNYEDGKQRFIQAYPIPRNYLPEEFQCPEINIDSILEEALRYVN